MRVGSSQSDHFVVRTERYILGANYVPPFIDRLMDLLLSHGYFLQEDEVERRVMKPYPPLGILYLSSYLKSRGVEVSIFDSTFRSKKDFFNFVDTTRPKVVGIYCNLMTKLNVLEMMKYCKSKGSVVIVGGPEPRYYAKEFVEHGADVVVRGEGELTLEELLPRLHKEGLVGLEQIPGIAYRNDVGNMVETSERAMIKDLDSLPLPDRESIQMEDYMKVWKNHHGRSSISLICARGCPYHCRWCSRAVFGETHRRRSVKNVVDEIELLQARYNPDMLWFADDVFTINYKWFFDFYREMKTRGFRIPFECISRADRLNEELIRCLAELGCFRIWYGSESGSQRILDAMERGVTVEQIRSVTNLAKRYGIRTGLFVMLGYPGEEVADIEATIKHLIVADADEFLTTVAYPIKGTPFYEDVRTSLIERKPWNRRTERMLSLRGRYSDTFYWFANRRLVNEVQLHRIMKNGTKRFYHIAKTFTKAKVAKLGMQITSRI